MENKKIIIAPIDSESQESSVFFTLREFPTERMIFLTWPNGVVRAQSFSEQLKKFSIPSSIITVQGKNPWEDFYRALVDVCEGLPREKILINISTADRISQCALTNAAHVNGLMAIAVINGKLFPMPILRVSFSEVLSDKKMKILHALDGKCMGSLEDISRKTKMSLQLVSYHINGTRRSQGLAGLELVEASEEKGRVRVCLSTMGRLFVDGYIRSGEPEK